jgi:hypothetical protein
MLLVGCSLHRPVTSAQLIGSWKGEPYESQLGKSVNSICFHADGTVESVIDTQAGPILAKGTYKVSGDTLILRIAGADENTRSAKVRLVSGTLTLTYDHEEVSYRKIANACIAHS